MGGAVGGKDVFYSFASAKNTMFLKLFRSNGKERTLSTDQLMRAGSLLQSGQSFSTAPAGGVMCTAEISALVLQEPLTQNKLQSVLFCGKEKPKGRHANQLCLCAPLDIHTFYPEACFLQDCLILGCYPIEHSPWRLARLTCYYGKA